ncbi:MAG: Ig-like domain-containing protein [Bacteroidales bacterium]
MNSKNTLFLTLVVFVFSLSSQAATKVTTAGIDWAKFLAQHDMYWTSILADSTTTTDTKKNGYYSGALMGNGLIGTNFYKLTDKVYRLNASRSDISEIRTSGDKMYGSARLPVGYFTLSVKGNVTAENMRLSLYNAITSGTITTDQGKVCFRTYVHSQKNYIVFNTDAVGFDTAFTWTFVPYKAVSPRYINKKTSPNGYLDANGNANPVATTVVDGDCNLTIQKLVTSLNGAVGKVYVVAWKQVKTGSKRSIIATISQQSTEQAAIDSAKATIAQAFALDDATLENSHKAWWHDLYPKSFVAFPNTKYESFYWAQLYKFACASHSSKPIVDLQGPWPVFNTPWPLVWMNLNLQLTYSWQVKANQGDLTKPLWESLNSNINYLRRNVTDIRPPSYAYDQSTWTDALCLYRFSGYNLYAPLNPADASANVYEVGNLTWTLFYYWQYCASHADTTEMKTRFFPMLKQAINLYFYIRTGKDANGKWNLPPTGSPEYQSTSIGPNANYDLAILRWGLTTLLDVNNTYNLNDAKQADWKDFLDNLADYPVDNLGYMVSSTVSFTNNTHRHYSHLFMIYPFHLVDWANTAQNTIMTTSVNNWKGSNGYSYTGKAAMLASKGDGNGALTAMNSFLSSAARANTLYGESGPCFETPMAANSTLHEFYLQDWGTKIRVFPAMPTSWADASFINLRANGAFLISATRKTSRTVFIQVESEAGGLCRLQTGMTSANLVVKALDGTNATYQLVDAAKGVIEVMMKAGDLFQVTDKTLTVVYPAPITHPAAEKNFYGVNKGPNPIEGIVLNFQSLTLTESVPSATLQTSLLPTGVAAAPLNWKSTNENIVKVNNGLVISVASGNAQVIVSSLDGYASDTCNVQVKGVISGIDSKEIEKSNVYPLVTDSYIHIFSPTANHFNVVDSRGSILKSENMDAGETKTISLSNCGKGLYLVVLGNKSFKVMRK